MTDPTAMKPHTQPASSPARRPPVARRGASVARRRGFTLLELLLVMGLIGMIAGIGLGMFASFDPGRRAALGLVQNVMRQAQQSAVARRAPASVRIDTVTGTLVAEALEVAGTWHFETPALEGGRGIDAVPFDFAGDFLTPDGYTGSALDFARGGRRSRVQVELDEDPLLDPRRGFALDVALRPEALSVAKLVDIGNVVQLSVRGDGGLDGRIITRRFDDVGREIAGPPIVVRSAPGVLRMGRWTHVTLAYDRRELTLSADGVLLVSRGEERELWNLSGPLMLGDPQQGWQGALDQLVLATVRASEEYALPESVRFDARTPKLIRFLAGGSLDPALHAGTVTFGLVFDDGGQDEVVVNLFGTVE